MRDDWDSKGILIGLLANISYYTEKFRPNAWANETRAKFDKIGIHCRE